MAILGKRTVGVNDYSRNQDSAVATGPFLASEDGIISGISVYTDEVGGSIKLAVYEVPEGSSTPTTRVAATGAISVTQAGWQTGAATGNIVAGRFYWIGIVSSIARNFRMNYTQGLWVWGAGGTFAAGFPVTFVAGGATRLRAISAYFDYTPIAPNVNDTSLQARINRATPGSTVKIKHGFYNECLVINKPLKLVGEPDRKGRLPIVQSGQLVTGWTLSTATEHVGKNVWYKDGMSATWIRALQLDGRGVQVIQPNPSEADAGASEAQATTLRNYLLENPWNDTSGHKLSGTATINFWQWYEALAALTPVGRLYLRLRDNVNPNDLTCYLTLSQGETDKGQSDQLADAVTCSNQSEVTIRNIEIRGGTNGIKLENSSNVLVQDCRVNTPGIRGIWLVDSMDTTISRNEITGNWMQSNCVPGVGGSSDKAKAGVYCWDLSKSYSVMDAVAPHGRCIDLYGTTDNATISRNRIYQNGGGVGCSSGFDNQVVNVVIEDNIFENLYSAAVAFFRGATGTIANNIFRENNIMFRSQDMGLGGQASTAVQIVNNTITTLEAAGNMLQAHYFPSTTTWTHVIAFNNNFVQNVGPFIANQQPAIAQVAASGNVFDTAGSFSSNTIAHGMTAFTNNWVGGNSGTAPSQPWYGSGNNYTLNQRLSGTTLPTGFEAAGVQDQQKPGIRKHRPWIFE
jgi:parallel beta-helix repeat protein